MIYILAPNFLSGCAYAVDHLNVVLEEFQVIFHIEQAIEQMIMKGEFQQGDSIIILSGTDPLVRLLVNAYLDVLNHYHKLLPPSRYA